MRLFTQAKTGAEPATLEELKQHCPYSFEPDEDELASGDTWQEPLLYVYFAVNYCEEDLFHWLMLKANNFEQHEKLYQILA